MNAIDISFVLLFIERNYNIINKLESDTEREEAIYGPYRRASLDMRHSIDIAENKLKEAFRFELFAHSHHFTRYGLWP